MALLEPSVLANAIMGKLYNVLTNGDDTVPKSDDNFFSWCTPGIPVEPSDLEYLTQGLTGVVKKAAVDAMQPSAAAATVTTMPLGRFGPNDTLSVDRGQSDRGILGSPLMPECQYCHCPFPCRCHR